MRCCKNASESESPLSGCFGLAALIVGVALLAIRPAHAGFEIINADSHLTDGVYHVDLEIAYDFSSEAITAMDSGVALTVTLEIKVRRDRDLWVDLLDQTTAELIIRYRIEKHPLTNRYIVRNMNSGASVVYQNYAHLAANMGRIHDLPVIDAHLLDSSQNYYLEARTGLDLGDLPVPMRLQAYFTSPWQLESQWFQWPLLNRFDP